MAEKWVAVHVNSYQEVEEVVGIFESEHATKSYIEENHYYSENWYPVRIQRSEYDKWA